VIALVLFTVFKQFDRGAMQGNQIGYSEFLDEVQAKRLKEEAKKMAAKSHSERVSELNEKLKKAPEHNDLFRISYGGQG
jgi:cell division protease FtsH